MICVVFLCFIVGLVIGLILGGGGGFLLVVLLVVMQLWLILNSGEVLLVIGLGIYQGFDVVFGLVEYGWLLGVLQVLFVVGGLVIDSLLMYGWVEVSIGELFVVIGNCFKVFVVSKVWICGCVEGLCQMEELLCLLCIDRFDLMQVYNFVDWCIYLVMLCDWKVVGCICYIGIMYYSVSVYDEFVVVMCVECFDFLQINYLFDECEVECFILLLVVECGMVVLINCLFGGGGLLCCLCDWLLLVWVVEIDVVSWVQLLFKFVFGQLVVICVIFGIGWFEYMVDNVVAGVGCIFDVVFWCCQVELFNL